MRPAVFDILIRMSAGLALLAALAVASHAEDASTETVPAEPKASASTRESTCLLIEAAARANGLPVEFFARVIWQESRFRPDAIGPLTRSGSRAEGIAQFMPATAAERSLLNPFDPVQALPKSAEFLRELQREFGNLGLAAAAYNAGPQRVRDWLAGARTMPGETRNYVFAITGASVDDWAQGKDTEAAQTAMPGCDALIALLKTAPNPFVQALQQRVATGAQQPWGVQLSAGFVRHRVLAAYGRLETRHRAVLAGQDPTILATRLRSRGTRAFYQMRVGAATRPAAENLCARLRRAGAVCMVLRNPRGGRG